MKNCPMQNVSDTLLRNSKHQGAANQAAHFLRAYIWSKGHESTHRDHGESSPLPAPDESRSAFRKGTVLCHSGDRMLAMSTLSPACSLYPGLPWVQFCKTILSGGVSYRKLQGKTLVREALPTREPLGSEKFPFLLPRGWVKWKSRPAS